MAEAPTNSIRAFLLKAKPAAMLLALKDTSSSWYPSRLAQVSGASYVYITIWLDKLEKGGWVRFERKGRMKMVLLTEKGSSVASALEDLSRKMETKPPAAPPSPVSSAAQ
jgi:predicted transcriptional regulator